LRRTERARRDRGGREIKGGVREGGRKEL